MSDATVLSSPTSPFPSVACQDRFFDMGPGPDYHQLAWVDAKDEAAHDKVMPRSPTPFASLSSAHFFSVHAGGGPLQRTGLDDLPGGGRAWLVSDGEGGKEKGGETRQDDHALLGSPVQIDRWVGRQEGG